MTISVHLLPSNLAKHEHGHMTLGWSDMLGRRSFRGYFPFIKSIPPECRTPEKCRDYLLHNCVTGEIVNDVHMRDKVEEGDVSVLSKSWPANRDQQNKLKERTEPRRHGTYSFNPNKFPGSHNCVTWCVEVINAVLGLVLQPVPQGRISLIAKQFIDHPSKTSL